MLYNCGKCDKKLTTNAGLRHHVNSMHIGKLFRCEFCESIFKSRSHLNRHINAIHSNMEQISCEKCNKTILGRENLKAHNRYMHETRMFECDLCGKCFSLKSMLGKHKLKHDGNEKSKIIPQESYDQSSPK